LKKLRIVRAGGVGRTFEESAEGARGDGNVVILSSGLFVGHDVFVGLGERHEDGDNDVFLGQVDFTVRHEEIPIQLHLLKLTRTMSPNCQFSALNKSNGKQRTRQKNKSQFQLKP